MIGFRFENDRVPTSNLRLMGSNLSIGSGSNLRMIGFQFEQMIGFQVKQIKYLPNLWI